MRAPFRHRDFRALVAGLAISQTGDWLYNVALLVFVLRATHSASWVAAAGIVRLLPYVLFGTVGGVIADRFPRKRVMIASDLARAVLMSVLAVVAAAHGAPIIAILLSGVSTTFAVAYGPCVNAAMPVIVDEGELSAANSIASTIQNVCIALGPAVGGVLLVLGSAAWAFAFNALTFCGSAIAVSLIGSDLGPATIAEGERPAPFVERLREGVDAIRGSSEVVVLVGAWTANAFLYGMEIVLLALVATQLLRIGDNGLSFIYAAFGVGGISAAFIAHRSAERPKQGAILAVATLTPGIALAGFALTHVASVGYLLAAVDGGSSIVLDVLILTSLQRLLGNEVLGRAFGAIDSIVIGAMLLGSLLAPPLVSVAGLRGSLAIGGGIVAVVALLVLGRAAQIDRGTARRAEQLAPRVAVLEQLGIFEGASRATLEALAAEIDEEHVAAGTVVIREGDDPDDLFVAVRGRLSVSVTGRGVIRELGSGDYFGEIGLLEKIPRTATVTAIEDAAFYRIPGDTFLSLVNEGLTQRSTLVQNLQARLAATRTSREETSG